MKSLKYLEIRDRYLEFFKRHGHSVIPSASLVPENDPSVLFVNSGMFPLVPYLLGEKHPQGTRLTNSQRCIRTGDIEEVGDAIHCTAFEMLGHWSLNDYFKDDTINMTFNFFVDELGIDPNNLYATVFIGDEDAPKDTDSIDIWKKVFKNRGIDAKVGKGERIQEYGKDKNWWGLPGGGPCGPDTEIFYDTGKQACGDNCHINCDCGKFIEIGNNVLMQYLNTGEKLEPLGMHNVDFGGGLIRIAQILQGVDSIYDTDIYSPIYKKVSELSTKDIEDSQKSKRIIVDHINSATWIIADGVTPGRTEREYILRRIIRRAIRHGNRLGIQNFTKEIAEVCIKQFSPILQSLTAKKDIILNTIEEEEKKFNQTLENGLKEFDKVYKKNPNDYSFAFKMYETYGFPLELYIEELQSRGVDLDKEKLEETFNLDYTNHQNRSRSASKGLFKGGLADTSEMSTKYHTATHLLLSALYQVVGSHIYQKGSNINTERLRLDFPNEEKLTQEQISEVENLINEQIEKGLPITFTEMKKEEAMKIVKYAAFEDKYGDTVKVYTIGSPDNPFSQEICGGPHVKNTSELGKFKIIKQENVAAGVKRIKAVLT